MKSEHTPFVGGPLDGRVLPVLLGPTGHPPKWYCIPVPAADGGPPTVFVYRRVSVTTGRWALHRHWRYEHDPSPGAGTLQWPWTKRRPTPPE